jgi:hypothetical protein
MKKAYSFKSLLVITSCFFTPFIAVSSFCNLFGIYPIYVNEKPFVGIKAFALSMLYGGITIFLLSLLFFIVLNIGLYFLRKCFPRNNLISSS